MAYDPRYLEGLRLYECGRYWDSHEEWEQIWHHAAGELRHFLQGLIQLDAALIHTERGHWRGVANLLQRALGHLDQCPEQMWGLDVSRLRSEMRRYREAIVAIRDGRSDAFDWALKPELRIGEPQRISHVYPTGHTNAKDR
jgi:predicted metal-dependent hydrolase